MTLKDYEEKYVYSVYGLEFDYDDTHKFMYNTASGSGILVDKSDFTIESYKTLIENGIIVPKDLDEFGRQLERKMNAVYGNNFKSQLFVIAPSMECNANCTYCFEEGKRLKSSMSPEIQDKTISFIKKRIDDHPETQSVSLSFFGGEPTLQKDCIIKISKSIKEYLDNKNIKYNGRIITNGLLYDDSLSKELYDCGITAAQITIDGSAESWSKKKRLPQKKYFDVLDNIASAASNNVKLSIRVNIDNSNKDDLLGVMNDLLNNRSLNGKIKIYPAQIKKWNDNADSSEYISDEEFLEVVENARAFALKNDYYNSFDSSLPASRDASCGMVKNSSIGIRYDGNLYSCEHCFSNEWIKIMNYQYSGYPYECSACVGDLDTGRYYNEADSIFKSEQPGKNATTNRTSDCTKCAFYPVCHGGCRMELVFNNKAFNCTSLKRDVVRRLKYKMEIIKKEKAKKSL